MPRGFRRCQRAPTWAWARMPWQRLRTLSAMVPLWRKFARRTVFARPRTAGMVRRRRAKSLLVTAPLAPPCHCHPALVGSSSCFSGLRRSSARRRGRRGRPRVLEHGRRGVNPNTGVIESSPTRSPLASGYGCDEKRTAYATSLQSTIPTSVRDGRLQHQGCRSAEPTSRVASPNTCFTNATVHVDVRAPTTAATAHTSCRSTRSTKKSGTRRSSPMAARP